MPELNNKLSGNNLMPTQEYARSILRKRAITLAKKNDVEELKDREMFLHIYLGNDEHYGIPYPYLDEILRPRPITPIPSSSKIIAGVIPYRGELIAVLDLSQMLNVTQANEDDRIKKSWFVIININKINIALLANEVHGNHYYQVEELSHSLNSTLDKSTGPILGIFDGKIAILDLATLLNTHYQKLEKN